MSDVPPTVYQYSVKLETTQKCVNVTVHVYGEAPTRTKFEAIDLLMRTREQLEAEGFTTAPLKT